MAGRRFRVPIIDAGETKNSKKNVAPQMNESKWFEKLEKQAECKVGKIDYSKDAAQESDSDSGDDDLLKYWIQGEEELQKASTVAREAPKSDDAPPIKDLELIRGESEQQPQVQPNPYSEYSHVLSIPLFDCQNVKKRVESFKKRIIDDDPTLSKFLNDQKLHLPILYLNSKGEELETLIQILSIPDFVTTDKKKARVDVQSINFACKDNSKNAQKADSLYTSIKRNEEANKMDETIHQLISKMIEFGVCSEHNLANCRFDISASKYRVEKWQINLLHKGPFDSSKIMNNPEYKDFFFGTFDFNLITLSKNDQSLTQVSAVKL